ncbi:MAG: tRNA (adenosine(37)-N6)-dimethylallyltransferase MiaA [Hydrogenophilales bacterium]|nr:tRNA (adenosine(37)-N6)-dimethylallyltransferase MiaA [Hydrogenophilales bacterium]
MGPTASGKTGIAVELVQRLPLEIISVDSALVYRHMNIGTAKPDAATLAIAPHHLIDIIDPTESYSAAQFRHDALRLMADITARGKIPLLAGGTMLYFKALREGLDELPHADPILRAEIDMRAKEYGWPALHAALAQIDPETAARLKPTDAQRIQRALEIHALTGKPMSALIHPSPASGRGAGGEGTFPYRTLPLGLMPSDRAVLHQRIADRFDTMLAQGLIEEVKWLREHYALNALMPSMRCVGYRQTWQYLEGEFDYDTLRDKGLAATRQLAKRQMTWLRGMGDAVVMDCLDDHLTERVGEAVNRFLDL